MSRAAMSNTRPAGRLRPAMTLAAARQLGCFNVSFVRLFGWGIPVFSVQTGGAIIAVGFTDTEKRAAKPVLPTVRFKSYLYDLCGFDTMYDHILEI